MRCVAAVVATVCLLGSGCTAIVKRPSGTSLLADLALGTSAALVANDQYCKATKTADLCFGTSMTALVIGGPAAVIGLVAGAYALANPPPPPEPPPALPARTADAETLELARTVRGLVRGGYCEEARRNLEEIAARDAEYHIALLASDVLGACQ